MTVKTKKLANNLRFTIQPKIVVEEEEEEEAAGEAAAGEAAAGEAVTAVAAAAAEEAEKMVVQVQAEDIIIQDSSLEISGQDNLEADDPSSKLIQL